MAKKCLDCGKELPDDSKFCQYCGSGNIEEVKKPVVVRIQKKCLDCGKDLPDDSKFCQYCGSKNVVGEEIVEELSEEKTSQDDSKFLENQKSNDTIDMVIHEEKKEQKPVIKEIKPDTTYTTATEETKSKPTNAVAYLSIIFLVIFLAILFYTKQSQEITDLNTKISSLESKLKTAEKKANKYETASKIANQDIYTDFRADSYFVKGTKKTIYIYCNINNATIQPTVTSGSGIGWEWGDWKGSGVYAYCPMTITCPVGKYGVITFKNDKNDHTFKVFVTGQ